MWSLAPVGVSLSLVPVEQGSFLQGSPGYCRSGGSEGCVRPAPPAGPPAPLSSSSTLFNERELWNSLASSKEYLLSRAWKAMAPWAEASTMRSCGSSWSYCYLVLILNVESFIWFFSCCAELRGWLDIRGSSLNGWTSSYWRVWRIPIVPPFFSS